MKQNIKPRILSFFLFLLLVCDFSWSFHQYYHTRLDGDMAGGIVTDENVQKILNDPFGVKLLVSNEPHANPNRYFGHLFFKYYFRSIPALLQSVVTPIDSVYLAASIIKLLIHLLIVYFLAALITQQTSVLSSHLLFIALFITSLFQTYGFNQSIGIIDTSITYTFFYALPAMLLLLFIFLFWKVMRNPNLKGRTMFLLVLFTMAIILPFTGPLIPPLIIILSGYYFLYMIISLFDAKLKMFRKKYLPLPLEFLILLALFVSVYSLYLGTFDNQFINEAIPLSERYNRLLIGLNTNFLSTTAFRAIFQILFLNIILLYIFNKRYRKFLKINIIIVLTFSCIYLFLLPIGGYRAYRELIIRYDTLIPVSLILFYFAALTSHLMISLLRTRKKLLLTYLIITSIFIYSYTIADTNVYYENTCERNSLELISKSPETIVVLPYDCTVLSWKTITNHRDSYLNSKLLQIFDITKDNKMYYTQCEVISQ